ncbi:MAG: nicotinamide mononucleotide transporter, partial [Gemmatimonadetes bacterium]|nr:nicotinamide mononucleotide transporter [Gemmatimonadota bacterium]
MSVLEFLKAAAGNSPIEWIAVVFGIVSVYLSVRENIWSWPTAIVNVALYVYIFLYAKLYADMGLQVVYVVINAYGWWNWLYGGANHSELRVTRITARQAVVLTAIGAAFAVALWKFLAHNTDAALPWADSALTAASLVAQYLLTKKVLENWAIWVAADVGYIALYIYKGLNPTAFLYAVFLLLSVMGWIEWKR